jgi:autotransporter-associated beta strand protein
LTKNTEASSTLTLSNANDYTGTTTVSTGTLKITDASALGGSAAGQSTTVDAGATLEVAAAVTTNEPLTINGIASTNGALYFSEAGNAAGPVTLGTTSTIGVASSGSGTISGAISGSSFGITKQGTGTLTLSGDNTYTGTTAVSAGTVVLGAADRISNSSAVIVSNNATFNLAGFDETVASIATSLTTDSAAKVTLSSTSAANTLTTVGNSDATFAGVIEGTNGKLTKQGSGTLTLSGANSFDGVLTISAGTVSVGAGSTVGTIATQSVVNSGTLMFNRSDAITYAGVVSGTGALQKSGLGTLTLSNANTYSGNTTINALGGNITISGTGSLGTVTAGSAVYPGNIAITDSGSTLTFGSSTTQEFSGIVSGAGSLTKSGNGTLTLSGANTYGGATTVRGRLPTCAASRSNSPSRRCIAVVRPRASGCCAMTASSGSRTTPRPCDDAGSRPGCR